MRYHQITPQERYTFGILRKQGCSDAEIARLTGRHRSTIGREFYRNFSRHDGSYRPSAAQEHANARRFAPRRNSQFGEQEWSVVDALLRDKFSPEQVSGWLRLLNVLEISHETIYLHVWRDKLRGGQLYRSLRQPFKRRKRYGTYEKRGRVEGKRHISERPAVIESRSEIGHWEIDTVIGAGNQHCVVTLVERVTGATLIGKLHHRRVAALNQRVIELIQAHPGLFKTITADNGTEFHGYEEIERTTGVTIYFATPYHSWERGTNENTNGLIRQYLPKRTSMKRLTQDQCNTIASSLNNRPRKRHGFRTPLDRLAEHFTIA
jgi:Transposase and inactivated derivatives, IS30 family